MGMKAAVKHKFGSDSLDGKKILVQGVGHVGETLVKLVSDEGAQVIINDINENRLENEVFQVDLSEQNKGIYFIQVNDGVNTYLNKLIYN